MHQRTSYPSDNTLLLFFLFTMFLYVFGFCPYILNAQVCGYGIWLIWVKKHCVLVVKFSLAADLPAEACTFMKVARNSFCKHNITFIIQRCTRFL